MRCYGRRHPDWPSLKSQALVDAGGEAGARLVEVLTRRIEEMAVGQILEVVSIEPSAAGDVYTWSTGSGHTLLDTRMRDDATWLWIEKAPVS